MKRFKITTREIVYTDFCISVPDDCTDPVQFFYDMDMEDQEAGKYDSDCFEWEVVECTAAT